MRSRTLTAILLAGCSAIACAADVSVPGIITYQGSLSQAGQAVDGTVAVKAALVDHDGATLWSHDGTSINGSEPTSSLAVAATKGVFSLGLGDIAQAGASQPLPPSVFSHAEVRLRLWVRTGTSGAFTALTPDVRLTAVGYALRAATVADQAIGPDQLAANAVSLHGTNVTGVLPIARGGTGATTVNEMRSNLGLGSAAVTEASTFATAAQGAKADSAVQPASLGSAAFQPSTAFATADQGTKADTAVQPDHLATVIQNTGAFATAAQGAKADTAIQPESLGSAAYQNTAAFATAAQGAKADSAVQPASLGSAAHQAIESFATAAQGAKADSAVQPGTLAPTATAKCSLNATRAPLSTDDSAAGYVVGSWWIQPAANKSFICLDATAGAANWRETTGADLDASTISTGTLAMSHGGTGATTASAARTALGVAAAGANTDITSLGGLTTALSISQGGTGQSTAGAALTALLPSQTGQAGRLLGTDGNTATWLEPGTVWTTQAGASVTPDVQRGTLLTGTAAAVSLPTLSTGQSFRVAGIGADGWSLALTGSQSVVLGQPLDQPAASVWTTISATASTAIASRSDGSLLYLIRNNALVTSVDGGTTVTSRDSSTPWKAVTCSPDGVYATAIALTSTAMLVSSTSGATWTSRTLPAICSSVAISQNGTTILAGSASTPTVYLSTDNGATWSSILTTSISAPKVAMAADASRLIVADYACFRISTNLGSSWTSSATVLGWSPIAVACSRDGSVITGCSSSQTLLVSTDSGATTTVRESARAWKGIACSADGRIQTACVNNGSLFVSVDTGVTWTARGSTTNWTGVATTGDGKSWWAVGTGGIGLAKSTASTTQIIQASDPYRLRLRQYGSAEFLATSSTQVLVLSHGGGLWLE